MTAKGAHRSTRSKTGTPPRRRAKVRASARRATGPSSPRKAGRARKRAPVARRPRRGARLTALFTTPTPVDSIEALTGPDPIVDDSNGPHEDRRTR